MARYYTPIEARTGAKHQQPYGDQLRDGSAWAFTPDYSVAVDMAGALDAPDNIPSGSVRAYDGEHTVLGVAHVWRPGVHV
jgi:hypothetical protein